MAENTNAEEDLQRLRDLDTMDGGCPWASIFLKKPTVDMICNSFLCISNITDIFVVVQKIIDWKTGESEGMCLHGGLRLRCLAEHLLLYWTNFVS